MHLETTYSIVMQPLRLDLCKLSMSPLTVESLPTKYNRTYKASDRESDLVYEVNLARLECTCPEFKSRRARFAYNDARRICAHIFDKLYSTKAERSFDPLLQLFIRYGRSMYSYRLVTDEGGRFVLGQPFGPNSIRAIGIADDKSILATYNLDSEEWSSGETDLKSQAIQDSRRTNARRVSRCISSLAPRTYAPILWGGREQLKVEHEKDKKSQTERLQPCRNGLL